jgi:hypothetical protein
MGQNSTEVAYGFGQLGSVFQNLDKPVFPPKDHVIVAIQFLADNAISALHTETLDTAGPQFLTTEDDVLVADGGPDANFTGTTWAAVTDVGVPSTGAIPIVDVVANNQIKPGQIVLITTGSGEDGDDVDDGLTLDAAAGNIVPIYNGPNKQYMEVVSLSGGTYGTSLVVKEIGDSSQISRISSLDTANTLYFLDPQHGAGGTTTEGVTFPKGLTIYGRWIQVTPAADADGGIICYFGK